MQQFVVPQFIDVEDKVIGFITVRQFIIILAGSGIAFVAFKLTDFVLFLLELVLIIFFTIILAFVRVNGKPVHYFILNLLQTSMRPRLRLWQKNYSVYDLKRYINKEVTSLPPQIRTKNKIRASRLAELSLVVDTGGIYEGEKEPAYLQKPLS